MSISSMSDAKLVREKPAQRSANRLERTVRLKNLVERDPPAKAPQPIGVPQPVIQQLVRWIPTETITLYVALIALLNPVAAPAGRKLCEGDFAAFWWSVAAFAVATPFVVLAIYLTKVRATKQPFRWPLFEMGAAVIAFVAWAFALPNTPLQDVCDYKIEIGGFIVLVASIVIGLTAGATGHEPPQPSE